MQSLNMFKSIKSSELRGFLTGIILGDGSIDKGTNKRALEIKSINKEFIDFIGQVISNNTPFKYTISYKPNYIDKYKVNHKEHWILRIKAHPYFTKLYHYFYNDIRHRKIYSKTLNWLNPAGLACWYMSDGYICLVGKTKGNIINRRIDFCTDRYYEEDVDLMINILKSKFGIITTKIKRNKTFRIRIKPESYESFINLIKPYIVNSMQYKLYLGYTNKPNNLSNDSWNYQQYLLSAITQTGQAVG